jgi:hypothetical protein
MRFEYFLKLLLTEGAGVTLSLVTRQWVGRPTNRRKSFFSLVQVVPLSGYQGIFLGGEAARV